MNMVVVGIAVSLLIGIILIAVIRYFVRQRAIETYNEKIALARKYNQHNMVRLLQEDRDHYIVTGKRLR